MPEQNMPGSSDVARAAIEMSLSRSRVEETQLKAEFLKRDIYSAAVDFGGEFVPSIIRIIERTVIASKREGIINDSHLEEGGVAGAAREALNQITSKALGMNVGGKIGIARHKDHVAVSVYFGVGLGHLDEICIGLGHRAI